MAGAVVDQNDAGLIEGSWLEATILREREVEVAVVVQVHEVPFLVIPGFRRVVAQRSRCTLLVDRERAVLFVSFIAVDRPRKVHPLAPPGWERRGWRWSDREPLGRTGAGTEFGRHRLFLRPEWIHEREGSKTRILPRSLRSQQRRFGPWSGRCWHAGHGR